MNTEIVQTVNVDDLVDAFIARFKRAAKGVDWSIVYSSGGVLIKSDVSENKIRVTCDPDGTWKARMDVDATSSATCTSSSIDGVVRDIIAYSAAQASARLRVLGQLETVFPVSS